MNELARGAEAVIYRDDGKVAKERIRKGYRIPEIDLPLRKARTKREAKVLKKLEPTGFVPKVLSTDEFRIEIDFIDGKKLADHLEMLDFKRVMHQVGEHTAILHNTGIIHGDLTTSNMILKDKVFFIDFGLAFFSEKLEDKAVDIHLLKEALESKHYRIHGECYLAFLEGYKASSQYKDTVARLEKVEGRGRYKGKH
jgi:Kae1-associated kinase Bud32